MPTDISELPFNTINLLKSSQVISSFASVVKELIENALDAHSTVISVKLDNYGLDKLEIKDNGMGIKEDNVEFAAKPHFTSKIRCFEDLDTLSSYGFRGEALSSLCAVSDVTLNTKCKDDSFGYSYKIDKKGNITNKKAMAITTGTSILVQNLFKNIPVRRHFYSNTKRKKDEIRKIEHLVMAFAIIKPMLHISLVHDRNIIFQKPSTSEMKIAMHSIFQDSTKNFIYKHCQMDNLDLKVWLPNSTDLSCSSSSPDKLFIYVNHRPVSHKAIEKLSKSYYSLFSEGVHGRYPVGVIVVEVPSGQVDVNLEPNKNRIMFEDEKFVLEKFQKLLTEIYGEDLSVKKTSKKGEELDDPFLCCTFAPNTQLQASNPTEESVSLPNNIASKSISLTSNLQSKSIIRPSSNPPLETEMPKENLSFPCLEEEKEKDLIPNPDTTSSNGVDPLFSLGLESPPLAIMEVVNSSDGVQRDQLNSDVGVRDGIGLDVHSNDKIVDFDFGLMEDERLFGATNSSNLIARNSSDISANCAQDVTSRNDNAGDTIFVVRNDAIENVNGTEFTNSNHDSRENIIQRSKENICSNEIGGDQNQRVGFNGNGSENRSKSPENVTIGVPEREDPQQIPSSVFKEKSSSNEIPPIDDINCHTMTTNSVAEADPLVQGSHKLMKRKTDEHINDSFASKWSRGELFSGNQNIQTIKLLEPNILKEKNSDHSSKRKLTNENPSDKVVTHNTKRMRVVPPQKNSPIPLPKKPESPFSLFAKAIRKQVIEENPDGDFTVIAQELATRWKNADDATKQLFEQRARERRKDAELGRHNTSIGSVSSPKEGDGRRQSLLQRFASPKASNERPNVSKSKFQPIVKQRPWLNKSLTVNFSFEEMKGKMNKNKRIESNKNELIGNLKGANGWLYRVGDSICALNSSRMNEVILFRTLIGSFSIPTIKLEEPLPMDDQSLGKENWETLLTLNHKPSDTQNVYYVIDPRVASNGFKVSLLMDTDNVLRKGEITGVADSLPNYGIQELKEILSKLRMDANLSLEKTRPAILHDWFKTQSLRMSRSSPHIRDSSVIGEKIEIWSKLQRETKYLDAVCLHGHSIFNPIYSLDETCQ